MIAAVPRDALVGCWEMSPPLNNGRRVGSCDAEASIPTPDCSNTLEIINEAVGTAAVEVLDIIDLKGATCFEQVFARGRPHTIDGRCEGDTPGKLGSAKAEEISLCSAATIRYRIPISSEMTTKCPGCDLIIIHSITSFCSNLSLSAGHSLER